MAPSPRSTDRPLAGLCVFGLTYACGFTWSSTAKRNPCPMTAQEAIDRAAADGLAHVELPVRFLSERTPAGLAALRSYGEERGVRLIVAGGNLPVGGLEDDLRVAEALGARVVRCTLSSILCGDRRAFPGGWKAHLGACRSALEKLLPTAERLGIAVAMENHQDADSDDLLALCGRFESRHLGITLDTGNPLAVMEHPLRFAERLARYIRHVHLKDYRIYHHAPSGFRLVRCAMGEGAIPFPQLFGLLDAQEAPITRSIEMAALNARLIPFLERSWWDEYPPRDARHTLEALELVWNNLRPEGEEFRTPLELDAPGEELLRYEWEQHERSVAYLNDFVDGGSIFPGGRP